LLVEPFSAPDYEMTLFIREKLQDIFVSTKARALEVFQREVEASPSSSA
jgi:hypothetical protein